MMIERLPFNELEHALKILKSDNERYHAASKKRGRDGEDSGRQNNIFASLQHQTYALLNDHCQDKTILDVGCGSGAGCQLLASFGAKKVIGVDLNVITIQEAQRQNQCLTVEFCVGNAEQLTTLFQDQRFDMIVVNQTIAHVMDKKKCMHELKALLAVDGACIISCFNERYVPSSVDGHSSIDDWTADVQAVFGDEAQLYFCYPGLSFAYQCSHQGVDIKMNASLNQEHALMCTMIVDRKQRIYPKASLHVMDMEGFQHHLHHDPVEHYKKDRFIFTLQQRALLAQAVILENQLLQQRIRDHEHTIATLKRELHELKFSFEFLNNLMRSTRHCTQQIRSNMHGYLRTKLFRKGSASS